MTEIRLGIKSIMVKRLFLKKDMVLALNVIAV